MLKARLKQCVFSLLLKAAVSWTTRRSAGKEGDYVSTMCLLRLFLSLSTLSCEWVRWTFNGALEQFYSVNIVCYQSKSNDACSCIGDCRSVIALAMCHTHRLYSVRDGDKHSSMRSHSMCTSLFTFQWLAMGSHLATCRQDLYSVIGSTRKSVCFTAVPSD